MKNLVSTNHSWFHKVFNISEAYNVYIQRWLA